MQPSLLICTDLDRTLIPNGSQPESPEARVRFDALTDRPEVTLAYVSGRHRQLVDEAMTRYRLPQPDFVVGDVGTSIYRIDAAEWQPLAAWQAELATGWGDLGHDDLAALLDGIEPLELQEAARQNRYKLSYYLPVMRQQHDLDARIRQRLESAGVRARLIWSVDEAAGIGLLDVLPERASKYHALRYLMQVQGFTTDNTVFCGDSGNDLEVLTSPIAAVLVANAHPDLKVEVRKLADAAGHGRQLYVATGGFLGMNGNYSAGILEGVAHYHPQAIPWMAGSAVPAAMAASPGVSER